LKRLIDMRVWFKLPAGVYSWSTLCQPRPKDTLHYTSLFMSMNQGSPRAARMSSSLDHRFTMT